MYDIVKADYVLVFQFFHERDLSDGRRRCALLGIKVDLLQSYELTSLSISTFKDLKMSVKAEDIVAKSTEASEMQSGAWSSTSHIP